MFKAGEIYLGGDQLLRGWWQWIGGERERERERGGERERRELHPSEEGGETMTGFHQGLGPPDHAIVGVIEERGDCGNGSNFTDTGPIHTAAPLPRRVNGVDQTGGGGLCSR